MIDLETQRHMQTKLVKRLTHSDVAVDRQKLGKPFWARFGRFTESFIAGDQLWSYDDIGFLAGTSGYAQVRNGQVIDILVIYQS